MYNDNSDRRFWSLDRIFTPRLADRGGGIPIGLALFVAVSVASSVANAQEPADYIFKNGAVYTVESDQPWADAVAVKDGRIVYVGTVARLADFIGQDTKVIDMAGGMLMPGFVDAHVHSQTLTTLLDADLTDRGYATPAQLVERLRAYVDGHPDEKIIRGTGWSLETFGPTGPTKSMLDQLVSDRPVVLDSMDSHYMWVNSKALELADITGATPDPLPGKSWFQRMPGSREPSGFVAEGAAMQMIRQRLIAKGYELGGRALVRKGYERGLPMLAAAGVTTVFDAGMQDTVLADDVLHGLETQGRLPIRVFGSVFYKDLEGVNDDRDPIGLFKSLSAKYHSDYLGLRMIKILVDGSENNYTAYMLEPYSDRPGTRGSPLVSAEELKRFVAEADAAGIDVHMHVVGDAAARIALDAIENAALKNGPRDRRHTLTHVMFIHPDDIGRFTKLGAIWQASPGWTWMNPRMIEDERILGKERFAERTAIAQTAIDRGVIMNFSSDFSSLSPGYPYKPLDQMQIGLTRQPKDQPDFRVMPNERERLHMGDLIRGYTINGAYMLRMETKIGSIKVGKQADLIVLDRNLFNISIYDVHKVSVKFTMMDGKVTYVAK